MKNQSHLLLFIVFVFAVSCSKESEEIHHPFFEIKNGDYWKYHIKGSVMDDVTGEFTFWDYESLFSVEKDTLIDGKVYQKTGNVFYRYENGNFFELRFGSGFLNGKSEIIYFKDNLVAGEIWTDTLKYASQTSYIHQYSVIELIETYPIDSLEFNDVVKLRYGLQNGTGFSTRYYAKGIGLIREDMSGVNIGETKKIIEHNK